MIGVTAGVECDAVSPSWLQPSFDQVDEIIVPSNFSEEIMEIDYVRVYARDKSVKT